MSDQQVLQAVRANSMAMNARVPDQYAHTFTEDLVWEGDHLPAPVIGRQAAVQVMGAFWSAFPDLHFEVEREFASGDQAAICWRVTGTHQGDFVGIPPTGKQVDYHGCAIFQVRDGKIARVWTYVDTGTILRQLGV
ncbi:MAG TPA: ester cyclase [Chloroflexota bacterium]|nr:ester cyclase [Chloroflexota bacterium]